MSHLVPPPDALGIPAPYWIFQFLSILTFVLHIIFMNYILGGSLIVAIQEWFMGRREQVAQANLLMIKVMPVALSMAITMGVAPLLFVQVIYGNFFYVANIMLGTIWFSIVGITIIAFYMIYLLIAKRQAGGKSGLFTKFGIVLNSILFLTVAFIFTNNAILTENPTYWQAIYSGQSWVIVPDASLWPRYLHNVIGAIAIAGLWCAVIGLYQARYHPQNADTGRWMMKMGLHWAVAATTLEIIVGIVFLVSLGKERIGAFMGNGFLFVGWAISVVTAIIALVCMVMAMMKPEQTKMLWASISLIVVTLFGMVMGRELVRKISLSGYFQVQDLPLRPSYSSLALFLVTFIIGLGVLVYLIRLVWTLPDKPLEDESTPHESGPLS